MFALTRCIKGNVSLIFTFANKHLPFLNSYKHKYRNEFCNGHILQVITVLKIFEKRIPILISYIHKDIKFQCSFSGIT
jgi:hypothetical protein